MRLRELLCLARRAVAPIVMIAAAAATAAGTPGVGVLRGVVLDATGGRVPHARVALLTASTTELRSVFTSDTGEFEFEELEASTYILAIEKPGFQATRQAVFVGDGRMEPLSITLHVGPVGESLTVTAARGTPQEVGGTPQFATVTGADELGRRGFSIFPQALGEEPGVHVQQTSTSQGSPFVRGLTGQQVVALVDGVRFNNATFRPGANQYTALIDAGTVDRVEIVRGPTAAQYGSDSLGGAINVLTSPGWSRGDRAGLQGGVDVAAATADLSGATNVYVGAGRAGWGVLVGGSGGRSQDLRTGGGVDSHSVATRLLGLPSTVLGDRLDSTAYTQYGAHAKALVHATANDLVTVQYLRGAQLGASRYDQLNGGAGNLLHRFDPQVLDFFAARYDRLGAGWFNSVSSTFSLNAQRDDRTYQSVNNTKLGLRSPVSEEHNSTAVLGYQVQAARRFRNRHSLVVGAELYDDYVDSTRRDVSYDVAARDFVDAVSVRGRFPNGARYRSLGVFAQIVTPLTRSTSATLALRYSRFRYSQSAADNLSTASGPVVPDYETTFDDPTFNAGLVYALNDHVALTGNVSRGFRAPNVNDFGSIGISGLGFEVPPDEAIRLGALGAPLSGTGVPDLQHAFAVRTLKPERAYNYEAGMRASWRRVSANGVWFDSEVTDLVERRSVVMAAGALGQTIGGQAITRQDQYGEVFTALSNSPVYVRANAGRVRLRGAEATLTWRMTGDLTLNANLATVRGLDLSTGLPPNIENGIPPTHGFVGVRWQPAGHRWWIETYSLFADAQRRFSSNDLQQARIGGIRTQSEITNFFNNGAIARGLVSSGILLATGEKLPQVLVRVLGPDIKASVPFERSNPGFATLNLRGGAALSSRSKLTVIFENVFDRNYRLMGSGIDAPGINVIVRYGITF